MGASCLSLELPSQPIERVEQRPRFDGSPLPHAGVRNRLLISGTSSPFSSLSAITRSAMALALEIAEDFVVEYTSTPGRSGTSAIQRPSVSFSVSIVICASCSLEFTSSLPLRQGIEVELVAANSYCGKRKKLGSINGPRTTRRGGCQASGSQLVGASTSSGSMLRSPTCNREPAP
jgi:hypothetical protein